MSGSEGPSSPCVEDAAGSRRELWMALWFFSLSLFRKFFQSVFFANTVYIQITKLSPSFQAPPTPTPTKNRPGQAQCQAIPTILDFATLP